MVSAENIARYEGVMQDVMKLMGADSVSVCGEAGDVDKNDVHLITTQAEAFIPLASLIDINKELERVQKEIDRAKGDILRAESKLNNESFVAKAPEKVVAAEREKMEQAKQLLEKLETRLADLKSL